MVVVRGTQKMLRRVSRESLDEPARSSTVLGDWYANLLFTRRARLVLLVSDRSLLSVLFPVRDCVNFAPQVPVCGDGPADRFGHRPGGLGH